MKIKVKNLVFLIVNKIKNNKKKAIMMINMKMNLTNIMKNLLKIHLKTMMI